MPDVPTEPPTLKHLAKQAVSFMEALDVLVKNQHAYEVLGLSDSLFIEICVE